MSASRATSGDAGLRSFEIEQAMHTLRKRLSMAAVQVHVPHQWSSTEQPSSSSSSSQLHAGSLSPPSRASVPHAESSTSPQSSSATSFATLSEEHERTSSESSPDREMAHPHNNQPLLVNFDKRAPALGRPFQEAPPQTSSAPSLYDVVFGASPLSKPNGASAPVDYANHSSQQMSPSRRSPHVRQGTSAQLERIALSPQLGSPKDASGRRDEHNHPSSYQLAMERRASGAIDWQAPRPEQAPQTPPKTATNAFSFTSQPALPNAQSANRQPKTPQHRRNRSLGGSLLPNGHPASSLAQDLGIASGSVRTPRSKQVASFSRVAPGVSPRTSSTSTFADPNLLTPRRKFNATFAQQSQPLTEGDEESSEAAAHSLLDLAASPSPLSKASVARFAGHAPDFRQSAVDSRRRSHVDFAPQSSSHTDDMDATFARPLKKRLVDGFDRNTHHNFTTSHFRQSQPDVSAPQTPNRHRGHLRTSSLSALRALQTPPSAKSHAVSFDRSTDAGDVSGTPRQVVFGGHKRTASTSSGRVRLMSPPMTPPRSDDVRSSKRVHYQNMAEEHMRASPKTPTKASSVPHYRRSSSSGGVSPPLSAERGRLEKSVVETPRTPPQATSTPQTPKAPGSNFSYGDFLHVSPSPQPRARTFSHHFGSAFMTASASGQERSMLTSLTETPSRGGRKAASRMLEFDGAGPSAFANDWSAKAAAMPSPHAASNNNTQGLGMMGLGSAFEEQQGLQEPLLDVEAGDEAYVLVPGKRAVATTRPKISHDTLRLEGAATGDDVALSAMTAPSTPPQRQSAYRSM